MVYLFPVLLIFFLILFFSRLFAVGRTSARITAREPLGRADAAPLALLTLAALLLGFFGLGDRAAPQTFYAFDGAHRELTVQLDRPYQISRIVHYCGGGHADEGYALLVSDGGDFVTLWRSTDESSHAAALAHDYISVYKWIFTDVFSLHNAADESFPTITVSALKVRTGSEDLRLGTLALFDENDTLISADHIQITESSDGPASGQDPAALLTDDYALIPAEQTFRNSTYFDEIYHARTAYELLHGLRVYETTHPPLGKILISWGIALFGMTPFGWRFAGAFTGALMVPVFYLLARELFRRRAALCAALVFLFDFMRFAQTRISTIDTYCVFFTLLMYYFMLRFIKTRFDEKPARQLVPLALCGISFGLGAAAKWQCFYAAFGLILLYGIYIVSEGLRMKAEGTLDAYWRRLAAVLAVSVCFFVLAAGAIYYLCYIPYARACGDKLTLAYVIERQKNMYDYHSKLTATHPYQSVWYQWILDLRPILYYRKHPTASTKSLIAAWMGPVACWGGFAALICEDILSIRRRYGELAASPDAVARNKLARRRLGFIAVGYLSMLVPWLGITRCAFAYHYFPCLIFLCLALAAVFERWADGFADAARLKQAFRYWPEAFAAVSAVLFLLFYPALSAAAAPNWWFSLLLRWFPSWPL